MTTYTNRSNAKRAGIAAGIPEEQVEITVHKVAGEKPRFGFKKKETQPAAPAKALPAAKRVAAATAPAKPRESRNGIALPAAGGACRAVWDWLSKHPESTLADVKAAAAKLKWNVNNATIELYRWRKFNAVETKKAA